MPPSPSLEQLEASLRAEWDLETLRVYADCLEAAGDPRGELIALELAFLDSDYEDEELDALRDRRLVEWLGPHIRPATFQFGLLQTYSITHDAQLDVAGYIDRLHASPAHPYLRHVHIFTGGCAQLEVALRRLAERPLTWLETLSVKTVEPGPVLADVMVEFAAAAPNLEKLVVRGERVFHSPVHPNLERVHMNGGRAIVMTSAPMAGVTELELTFGHRSPDELGPLAAVINPRAYPDLRHLDLSTNEWTYPTTLARNESVFRFVAAIETPQRLTHLRLPSLRAESDIRGLIELLARCPNLHVEVARMYSSFDGAPQSPRCVIPEPRPWPPRDQVAGRSALTICRPGDRYGVDVALSTCIEELEVTYDGMTSACREAWDQFWRFLDGLGWESDSGDDIELPLSVDLLTTIAETLDDWRWRELSQMLAEIGRPPEGTLMVRRYWGW